MASVTNGTPQRAWPRDLTPGTIELLKATAPVVKQHGTEITGTMYPLMFGEFPEVKNLFNMSHHRQRPAEAAVADGVPPPGVSPQAKTLANAVFAFAANCDQLGNLGEAVARMVHKHVSLDVRPEHYPIVGNCLLRAIKIVLKDAATPEIMAAWTEGYWFLADLLIDAENKTRAELEGLPGGWSGFRQLRVAEKVRESDVVTSFYLESAEPGRPLIGFRPGQYLSLKFPRLAGADHDVVRNYSVSSAPGDLAKYRISVKREPGVPPATPAGAVSSYLHDRVSAGDTLLVGPPCGHFFLPSAAPTRPLVFLAGGVGITPLLSMVEHLAATGGAGGRPVLFVQYARDPTAIAFRDHLAALAAKNSFLTHRVVYESAGTGDAATTYGARFDLAGLDAWLPEKSRDCEYYFCGPPAFMAAVNRALATGWTVPLAQRHYEYFGPTQDIEP
ncbi:hypothetical protein HK405_002634 [Cladochytrium tenue]|nr:hypothetical protein HK405_002634 [Cladochytrium tenue]